MKNAKYVKVVLTIKPIEDGVIKYQKCFILKGEYFSECNSIDEIKEQIEEEIAREETIRHLEIYTYKSKKDLKKDEWYMYDVG